MNKIRLKEKAFFQLINFDMSDKKYCNNNVELIFPIFETIY